MLLAPLLEGPYCMSLATPTSYIRRATAFFDACELVEL